tara:strand:+ start:8157 stop:9071 length:915 start_codon:yes stop_codon:yes gene_type:complete
MKKITVKTILSISLIFIFGVQSVSAQRWFKSSSLEFGLIGGFSHYNGELVKTTFEPQAMKPSFGIITRYSPQQRLTIRLSAQYGQIEGRDDWYEDRLARNLSFQSDLWDFTGALEYNFNTLDRRAKSGVIPYVYSGFSVFKFNPKAEFKYNPNGQMAAYLTPGVYAELADRNGEIVELQPLGTEGQETTEFNDRKRYALTQIAIPVGAGFKFKLSHNWIVGIDYGMRFTFTDYMDDVSETYVDPQRLTAQYGPMSAAMADRSEVLHDELLNNRRGDPDNNDFYGIFGVTIMYRIHGNRPSCPTF